MFVVTHIFGPLGRKREMVALVLRGVAILFGRWPTMCCMLVRQGRSRRSLPLDVHLAWEGAGDPLPLDVHLAGVCVMCVC